MNYTESFEQFASKVTPTDLALYAGVGIVLFVLFKDKLSPVQVLVKNLMDKASGLLNKKSDSSIVLPVEVPVVKAVSPKQEDLFFKLVCSWKQTRDLAVANGCPEAVKVADQMFPFLSPNVCGKEEVR